ncbi:Tn3 family transposase [Deinococcus aluminii]|uniref:Tn3 family transposase Tn2 n=1 Tax=Deinococcus aluminii TaxID=1656885 RepID=A0ABP9XJR8_9DEIO
MPVEFLSDEQAARYGRYTGDPSPEQLDRYFHLSDSDHALILPRRRDHNKLGFALQLCTLRFLGGFLTDPLDVPESVVRILATQLGVTTATLPAYLSREPTRHEHQRLIRQALGYRDFEGLEVFSLIRWLYAQLELGDPRPSLLFDLATARLVRRKVVLPGASTLARLITRVRERTSTALWRTLSKRLSQDQTLALEALLVRPEDDPLTPLERLRATPTRTTAAGLVVALERLQTIRALGVGGLDLSHVPRARLEATNRYVQNAWAQTIARLSPERRLASLLSFVQYLERRATDDALDILDLLLTELALQGEKTRREQRLRTLRDLDQAALKLREVTLVLLNREVSDDQVRRVAFDLVDEAALRAAATTVGEVASEDDTPEPEAWLSRYHTVRRFLPTLLRVLSFEATPAGRPVLEGLRFLASLEGKRQPSLKGAPQAVIPKAWRGRVFPGRGAVDRPAYTLCVLHGLQQALKRREVFVSRSERYGDPRAQLLQGDEWQAVKDDVCRGLGRSHDPEVELTLLGTELDLTYRQVAERLPGNTFVRLERVGDHDRLSLSPLEAQPDSPSLIHLRSLVTAPLPNIDLPELLLEEHARTGFLDAFTHASEGSTRMGGLAISLCAVLVAQACNIGLKAVAQPHVPALTLSRLSWVQQNYLRNETIVAANARLVEAQSRIPLVEAWGGGEVASADGLRFVVPVKTINARPNSKYFGAERGITYYNFTSDQFTSFHGITVPGTLRDSLLILAGLLEQQTHLDPHEIMSDTAGSSDVVFGLFYLLGYRFSPRLADLADLRYWRLDREAEYGVLQDLSRHKIDARLIARNWDDLLRLAGSLKLGKVGALDVMRTLGRSASLGRALAELGRIEKTLYLLHYVDDEAYRRRILVQLNRGEGRHNVARWVFHRRRGEVRQKYREGQEDQLGALGLVVNAIVLWNTRYLDAILNRLRDSETTVLAEDVARLSPLLFEHVNVLGRYHFELSPSLAQGALRPFSEPDRPGEGLLLEA